MPQAESISWVYSVWAEGYRGMIRSHMICDQQVCISHLKQKQALIKLQFIN